MTLQQAGNRLVLTGDNIQFMDIDCYGLKPFSKVLEIGEGRETGCNRIDRFKQYVTYVGGVKIKGKQWYCFQNHCSNERMYLLYGSTGMELFTPLVSRNGIVGESNRFYKPIFKVEDE